MRLSFSTFAYINYPLEEAIIRIAECGYDAVEIWGGRPHAYPHDLTRKEIAGIKALLREKHLSLSAFIPAQFRYPTNLCISNERIRLSSVQYIKDSMDTAYSLGAEIVVVCPGHSLYGQSQRSAWSFLRESLRELAAYAEDKGIVLALEAAHRYETDLVLTSHDALRMIEDVGKDNLKVLLDVGHVNVVGEGLAESVENLKGHLVHVHVDDNHGDMDSHFIPGDGTVNFTRFLSALRKSGYKGCLTVELGFQYTLHPDEAALESRKRLDKFLEEAGLNP